MLGLGTKLMVAGVTAVVIPAVAGLAIDRIGSSAVEEREAQIALSAARAGTVLVEAQGQAQAQAVASAAEWGRKHDALLSKFRKAEKQKAEPRVETVTEVIKECTWDSPLPSLPSSG